MGRHKGKTRGQNRTREIRLSGIAGGLQETWSCSERMRAPDFYPTGADVKAKNLMGRKSPITNLPILVISISGTQGGNKLWCART